MTQATIDAQEAKKEALKARSVAMEKEEAKLNEGKTGKGKRIFLSMTRGKNPQKIQYEAFDESKPDTLPVNVDEFVKLTKDAKTGEPLTEAEMLRRLIVGDAEIAYSEASDPIAEYVNPAWDDDRKKNFRFAVRNYAAGAEVSFEDAVEIVKPAIEKAFVKEQARKAEEAKKAETNGKKE